MKIAEVFYSIQGEGGLVGVPSVFVRTSGCNLRCAWCDTPYTSWNPEGTDMALDEILARVAEHPARNVVVTGGEPMIAPGIVDLTEALKKLGLHITIETAGTVFAPVACDLMSISPKLSNSTPSGQWAAQHERLRIQQNILHRLISSFEYQLKFVVRSPEDIAEILCLIGEIGAAREQVVLMPEGTERELLRERSLWLVELAKAHGFRFTPRLHVELWGNRRGV